MRGIVHGVQCDHCAPATQEVHLALEGGVTVRVLTWHHSHGLQWKCIEEVLF